MANEKDTRQLSDEELNKTSGAGEDSGFGAPKGDNRDKLDIGAEPADGGV